MLRPHLSFAGLCAGLMYLRQRHGPVTQRPVTKRRHRRPQGRLDPRRTTRRQTIRYPGGFSNNPDVKIELPGKLGKVAKQDESLRHGRPGRRTGNRMNKAAESAVTQAQTILVDAVKKMSVADAKGILSGGNDSATQYLRQIQPRTDPRQVPANRQTSHRQSRRGAEIQRLRRPGRDLGVSTPRAPTSKATSPSKHLTACSR